MTTTATDTALWERGVQLDSLIKPPSVAAKYINRTLPGGYSDFDTYEAAMASGHNVMVTGPTGTGKTHSARAFAASKGLPFGRAPVNGAMDVGAVIGGHNPREDGGEGLEWSYGILAKMIHEGRGVFVFDEINMGIERNMARFYPLWDSARELMIPEHWGECLTAHPGSDFLIVAAYNPGYRGSRELSQALPNRFAFRMRFDYDREIEEQLVGSPALLDVAAKLRGMTREIRTPVSTNMLQEFCEIAVAFNVEYAMANLAEIFPKGEIDSVKQVLHLSRTEIQADIDTLAAELAEETN